MTTETIEKPSTELAETQKADIANLALVTLDPVKYAAALYEPFHAKMETAIAESEAAKIGLDISTSTGYAIAVRQRAVMRDDFRLASEKVRVDRKAPILTIERLIDSGAKKIKDAVTPHEAYWDGLIKAEELRKEEKKAAADAAERACVEKIRRDIEAIRAMAVNAVGMPSQIIDAARDIVSELTITESRFAELMVDAERARVETLEKLELLLVATLEQEAEAARIAVERQAEDDRRAVEAARLKLEREQLDRDRIAQAALVAEQKRIADEAAAEAKAELKAAQDAFNAEQVAARAETARQQAEVQKGIDDAIQVRRAEQAAGRLLDGVEWNGYPEAIP